jgi:hypothetical protein
MCLFKLHPYESVATGMAGFDRLKGFDVCVSLQGMVKTVAGVTEGL